MNMYFHELKAYKKSTIVWTMSLVTLVVMFLSMFPGISKEAEQVKSLLQGYPEALRRALGLSLENIGSILGFYSYVFLYISLCGAIQAMNLGLSIISKEVREKTAEFLLSKPVSRIQIMTSKLLAALTLLVITNVIYLIVASVMASLVHTQEYSIRTFLLISLTLLFLQLIFLALGVLISVLMNKVRTVIAISLGTVFAFFFIGGLVSTTGDKALRYITPFKYFDFPYIVNNSSYESSFIVVALVFIALAVSCSYFIYCNRDISVG